MILYRYYPSIWDDTGDLLEDKAKYRTCWENYLLDSNKGLPSLSCWFDQPFFMDKPEQVHWDAVVQRIYYGGNLVAWWSKKQHTIARSSVQVENRTMTQTSTEMIGIKNFCEELGVSFKEPWPNQVAIYIANNPVFHERAKKLRLTDIIFMSVLSGQIIATPFTSSSK